MSPKFFVLNVLLILSLLQELKATDLLGDSLINFISNAEKGSSIRQKRFLPNGEIKVDGYYGYSDSKADDVERYFKEQNWRIIKAELKYLKNMEQLKIWNLADSDWRFLQVTRQILRATCPVEEVSYLLMKTVTRLFRYILADRREDNLFGLTKTEETKRDKILDVLSTCLNESMPYNFTMEYQTQDCHENYANGESAGAGGAAGGTNGTAANDTTGGAGGGAPPAAGAGGGAGAAAGGAASDIQICTCVKTYTGVSLNETVNNTCTGLDDELAWNSRDRDFISESIWKMFQFTHYHCAQHFSKDGSDLSVFHERVERFFYTDVIMRWANPGELGKKLWEFYFFGYNLPHFLRGLDTCLCAAKTHSEYTQPMMRPSIPTFRRKRSAHLKLKNNYFDDINPLI